MPRVVLSPAALRDMSRLRDFLKGKNINASRKAVATILSSLRTLETFPNIGRPIEDMPVAYREIVMPFGSAGYIARYHYTEENREVVEVLSIRHGKEVGFF